MTGGRAATGRRGRRNAARVSFDAVRSGKPPDVFGRVFRGLGDVGELRAVADFFGHGFGQASNSAERVDNDMSHWLVGDIAQLSKGYTRQGRDWTYYNGGQREVDIWYWTADPNRKHRWFRPLAEVWGLD